jgi:hypothetical protein
VVSEDGVQRLLQAVSFDWISMCTQQHTAAHSSTRSGLHVQHMPRQSRASAASWQSQRGLHLLHLPSHMFQFSLGTRFHIMYLACSHSLTHSPVASAPCRLQRNHPHLPRSLSSHAALHLAAVWQPQQRPHLRPRHARSSRQGTAAGGSTHKLLGRRAGLYQLWL